MPRDQKAQYLNIYNIPALAQASYVLNLLQKSTSFDFLVSSYSAALPC